MTGRANVTRPWSQPSWWVVVAGGTITIFFMVAIIREIVRTATVRRQVARLQQELSLETRRQTELQDLIGYLRSPTFQEREARLKLGLKKSGERVIVIPNGTDSSADNQTSNGAAAEATSIPQRWWKYFFGPATSSS